ncbi:MAG: hypothetical protein ACTSPD_19215 [Promethearchaeota archaeon]
MRGLKQELRIYKEIILKKLDLGELNTALNKSRSALTLIKENQEKYNLEKEMQEFEELNKKITNILIKYRNIYVRRLLNLKKEKVDESNIESLLKLLAILRSEVDKNLESYNLHDIQNNINQYFEYIKRLFVIFSSYKVINYFDAAETIYQYIKDLEAENFPNLENLAFSIYQELISRRLFELSKYNDKLSLLELKDKLAMNQEDLIDIIVQILGQPNSPIKVYNATTGEVIFNKK